MEEKKHHKNDMYGNIDSRNESDEGVLPPIPAATVVLLRRSDAGYEVLMLKKNSKITFGGMWVFPGGKIDAEDYVSEDDLEVAARNAAVRETREETSISLDAIDFIHFAHWTPPPGPQKRFATWFFIAESAKAESVKIDEGEIKDHQWIRPTDALSKHDVGDIDLVPPTWITLKHLAMYESVDEVLHHFSSSDPKVYNTRVVKAPNGDRVAMWKGDAGYEDWDAEAQGDRHRLIMADGGFIFENNVETY
jgi:8-oxo-dGTP pyrophosphatase MutT (NUDIX family)